MLKNIIVIIIAIFSLYELNAREPGIIQIIHNSADTSLGLIDLYVNGEKILGKMKFRTATPFFPMSSDSAFHIAVTRAESVDTLLSMNYLPEEGIATSFLLHGVVDTTIYLPNPDGKSIRLNWTILENISTKPLPNDEIAVKIADGCTDLATTDLIARDVAPLLPSMGFGGATPTAIIMPPTMYEFLLLAPVTREIVKSFGVDLSVFGGRAIVVFFSGFAEPNVNTGGKPLGIYAAFHDGTVVNVEIPLSVQEYENNNLVSITRDSETWMIDNVRGNYSAEIYSFLGEKLHKVDCQNGESVRFSLERGVYLLKVYDTSHLLRAKMLFQE
ncbi:MAG: DUF4397 domain-containing protein [Ignavibacteria bacterium]|nr:DUF4397 domain-containing protein [Ignavibacteria bacterium]